MTNTTEATPLSYNGDDSTDEFAISWKYFLKAHIVATLRDSAGTETVQVLDTDYTLTAPGDTGTLTMTTPPATGETLVITLEPPNTQLSDIPVGGAFPASTVEDALDLASQRDSAIEALFNRAIRVPKTDTRSGSQLELPVESSRASQFFAFDANGDPTTAAGTSGDLTPVSAFMNTLLDSANATAAQQGLDLEVGVDVQAYDANNALLDVAQAFTAPQRANTAADNDGVFDMDEAQHFTWTPAAADQLSFTNITVGQSGTIKLVNPSGYTITIDAAAVEAPADAATEMTVAGTYLLSYCVPNGETKALIEVSRAVS